MCSADVSILLSNQYVDNYIPQQQLGCSKGCGLWDYSRIPSWVSLLLVETTKKLSIMGSICHCSRFCVKWASMNNKISCSHLLSSLTVHNFVAIGQWRSQNIVVARAQVGQHIRCCAMREKLACEACPPGKFWDLGPPRSHLLGFQAKYM